ncbi:hypothetical protein [Nigerium sp.]|uniref:hypothetical protein n=1 Tax=Nigerium sp. TaxID=2042655 RepID=UPI003221647B
MGSAERDAGARVLVVDAANVVGSVPDGWWRDRAGAARRLHDHLLSAPLPYDRIVLVVEGRARDGVPEGVLPCEDVGTLTTVHAAASGDDEIVVQCRALAGEGASLTLATADHGLIARVEPLGVRIVGPRSVRES